MRKEPKKSLLLFYLICAATAWLFITGSGSAQTLYGSLTGTVTDSSEGIIPGASVSVTQTETNWSDETLTGAGGVYLFRNLAAGNYTLRVGLPGFKEHVSESILISVGRVTRHDVSLQIGDLRDSITVQSGATLLQTDAADLSYQLEAAEISDLPLDNLKNYQSLLRLVPGVSPMRVWNPFGDTPANALHANINGTARSSNNTRVDGASSVNIWLPWLAAYVPPSETIEVVDISTNNFDAERGFAGGAAITVITKSGTNEIHGSAFALHENSALNAREFFTFLDTDGDGKADPPKGRRTIGGFTIGGPAIHDRLFFFGGWEGTFSSLAASATDVTLPTADQRSGDFSAFLPGNSSGNEETIIYDPLSGDASGIGKTPFTNNMIPSDRLHPGALKMQALLPLPNLPGVTRNYELGGSAPLDRNNFDAKVDWYLRDELRLWGKWSFMDAATGAEAIFGPAGGPSVAGRFVAPGEVQTDVKVYGIGYNWTASPTLLADGNFGFTDRDQTGRSTDFEQGNFGSEDLGIPGTNLAPGQEQACLVDGINRCAGLPGFFVDGWPDFGQSQSWMPFWRDEDSATLTQNFSWSKGSHELRFGYDMVKHMLDHWQLEGFGPRGQVSFIGNTTSLPGITSTLQNSWASFLLGTSFQVSKSLQWETMTANEWQHAWYVRDRWQVTSNLSLNLGLRYEYFPLVSRDDRPMEVLDLNTTIPCDQNFRETRSECFAMTLGNEVSVSNALFAPRIGLAYRLSNRDVIRAGYGMTNSPIPYARPLRGMYPLNVAARFQSQNPNVYDPTYGWDAGIPSFVGPETAGDSKIPLPSFVQQRTMPLKKANRGYIQSWNLTYERKLPADFVISASYVGTQTVRQLADHHVNWAPPGGGNSGRQLSEHSIERISYWDGWLSANYHALQIAFNRRFTHGLFFKGAYTWSRTINMTDDEGWAGLNWNDPALIYRNRAQAGYNRPHMLQLATIYELPWGTGGDTVFDQIIGGWQLNAIFSANQNEPFTIRSGGSINCRECLQTADQVKSEVVKLGGIGPGQPYYDPSSFAPVTRVPGVDCTNNDCFGSSGRNILRGPTWVNLDFSLFRTFPLHEALDLEFRTEFFNLTNTPHFGIPQNRVNSPSFFEIGYTAFGAPPRIIRFGLKLIF